MTRSVEERTREDKAGARLAQEIVQAISDAGMKPGDRYLSEAEAMQKHKVGRNTLREAIRYLENLGVVRVQKGVRGGLIVDRPGWRNLASSIAIVLQFAGAAFKSVLEARAVIDPGLAELAASHATDEEIAAMHDILEEMEGQLHSHKSFHQVYILFWRKLAESTHNELLAFLSPALRAIVETGALVPDELYRERLCAMLADVLKHIEAREPMAARAAMVLIENDLYRRFEEGFPRHMQRTVSWQDLVVLKGGDSPRGA